MSDFCEYGNEFKGLHIRREFEYLNFYQGSFLQEITWLVVSIFLSDNISVPLTFI